MIRILSLMIMVLGAGVPCALQAAEWNEIGDAGPVLNSAQDTTGGGTLTAINGTITQNPTDVPINDLSAFGASVADVDLYKIFISNPAEFSAETINGDSVNSDLEFDATLILFDLSGRGVYLNDDVVPDDGNSRLPPGDPSGPVEPGDYYLAIADDNVSALSALSTNGPIFPDAPPPFTAVLGPTGPGGASPLIDWFPEFPINASRDYSILLTGVPEPGSSSLAAAALVTVLGLHAIRRRGDSIRVFGIGQLVAGR